MVHDNDCVPPLYLPGLTNKPTENQNKEYKWVKLNTQHLGEISNRFYIAPNPQKLHELVKGLVESFDSQNVPVRFKYQLTTGMEQCDRIIIYSDEQHKKQVEEAIKSVYEGVGWIDPSIAKMVFSNLQRPVSQPETRMSDVKRANNSYGLTERELDVLELMVEGLSNPQIADRLVITRATAKAHVHSILQKLCVSSRTQATVTAMKEGLV